jgi:PKD repeat protein/lysophospholipase L1-like esterase
MTRRAPPLALIFVLLLTGLLPAAVAAADPPLPSSMAAVGDSITRAASTGGTLGADYPANSWSTGTSTTVNSHSLRLQALGAQLTTHNLAVSGAKMANLDGQMVNVVNVQPDYVTVLMGGNDLCTDTVAEMTSVTDFRAQLQAAMTRLMNGTQDTVVYVVSIPNVYQLWNLFKGNWWARFIWSSADICQSLLANPTSTQAADVQRRETVRQRNIAYNAELASVCGAYARCRFDGNAVFDTTFTSSDVSGDYFHPSIAGQAKLASVSWAAGYTWATDPPPNVAPTASFTSTCVELTCSFTDTSTDGDGTIAARQWGFGDGTGSTTANPSHTYATGNTYTVTLTVTDDDGATASTSRQVTVTAPEEPPPPDPDGLMSVADLDGSSSAGKGQAWTASVAIRVVDDAGVSLSGATVTGSWTSGGTSTCTTNSAGSCTVSVSVNGKKATTTTWTVTEVVLAGYAYVAANNTDPDGDSDGTSITITRS